MRTPRRARRLAILGLLALAGAATHPAWLPAIGRFLVVDDGVRRADAVLPLAGDIERVAYAADLVHQGHAELLLLTPLPLRDRSQHDAYVARTVALARRRGVDHSSMVVVDRIASSTYEELQNVRAALEGSRAESLLIVTSPWHTRRAHTIARRVFAGGAISATVAPVAEYIYENAVAPYQAETWWTTPSTRRQTLLEYVKLVAHLLGVDR